MSTIMVCQWMGCITGVTGTLLLATKHRWQAWAWPLYLASNAAWIVFGYLTNAPGMIAMQMAYSAISFIGIKNWLAKPTEPNEICGFCGLPGADKIPHPVLWPDESSAGTHLVHEVCEDAECARASALIAGKSRDDFLRTCC